MRYLVCVLVVLCLALASLQLCTAQVPNTSTLTILATSDINQPPKVQVLTINDAPVDGTVTFQISYNFNTTICLNYMVPVPYSTQWPGVCSCFLNLTNLNGTVNSYSNSTSSLRSVARADAHPTPNYVQVQAVCNNMRSGVYYISTQVYNVSFNSTVTLTSTYNTCTAPSTAGPTCQNVTSIGQTGTPIAVDVELGLNFVEFVTIVPTQFFQVVVQAPDVTSFLTVWVRLGGPAINATLSDVNCVITDPSTITCTSNNPPAFISTTSSGVWYITLLAEPLASELSTQVNVTIITNTCPPQKFGLPLCNIVPFPLSVNATEVYENETTSITYYVTPVNTALNFSVTIDGIVAAPPIIVGLNNLPTLSQHLLYVNGSTTNVVNIPAVSVPMVIGVVGFANYSFFLTPCPNNCGDTNHGNCIAITGICSCRAEYEAIDCSVLRDSFKIEYIVLISIGGALVLAILVGVPIYCYLHRRKEYERV